MRERKIVDILALGAAAVFLLLCLLLPGRSFEKKYKIDELNSGWTCVYGDKEETVSLPASLEVPEGTEIVLTRRLPENTIKDEGLLFRTRMQSCEVRVDGQLIYQYPETEMPGGVLPSGWNFVKLPDSSGGKLLEVRLESPYQGFSGNLPEVWIGNYNDLIARTVREQAPFFVLSLCVGLTGGRAVVLSFIFKRYSLYGYQRPLGILLIFVSLWLMGESRMPLEVPGPAAQYYITLSSLLLFPGFIAAYICTRWPELCGRASKGLLYFCFGMEGVLAALQIFNVFDLTQMLPAVHILLAVVLCFALIRYIKAAEKGRVGRSELICMGLIFLSGFVELILFYCLQIQVGIFVRLSLLIYALDFLYSCVAAARSKLKETEELEKKLRRTRQELMSSQIRPHFIYNSLNSIRALIRIDPEAAYKAVYDFSTHLRANLSFGKENDLIPFADELKNMKAYLSIEKFRLGDRLQVQLHIQKADFPVPRLSIQPLIENAVKHGIWKKEGGGTIGIIEQETEKFHVIQVWDDGVGFDPEILQKDPEESGAHIGIKNVRFRIRELSGGTIRIQSSPGQGTTVTVMFPAEETKEKEGGGFHAGDRGRR